MKWNRDTTSATHFILHKSFVLFLRYYTFFVVLLLLQFPLLIFILCYFGELFPSGHRREEKMGRGFFYIYTSGRKVPYDSRNTNFYLLLKIGIFIIKVTKIKVTKEMELCHTEKVYFAFDHFKLRFAFDHFKLVLIEIMIFNVL